MSKKGSVWDWLSSSSNNDEIRHVEDEYIWAYEDDSDENDESSGADDYISSRPWGIDNDGY